MLVGYIQQNKQNKKPRKSFIAVDCVHLVAVITHISDDIGNTKARILKRAHLDL